MLLTSGEETYRVGEIIFKEGSHGRTVYVISSGKVEFSKMVRGKKIIVETLDPGDVFGMMTYIDPSPRSATALALEDTVVGLVDKNFLDTEFNRIASLFREILTTQVRRLRATTERFVTAYRDREERVEAKLRITFKKANDFFRAYIGDLSSGGLFIKTTKNLPVDTLLDVEFTLPNCDQVIHTIGKVVWTRPKDSSTETMPPGMGIQFIDMDPESRKLLENYIASFKSS